MLYVIKILDRIIDIILLLLFILLFLIGIYTLYDTFLIYNSSNNENLKSFRPIISDGEVSWVTGELSEDVVAWLTIEDTNIDYPILQGKDNSEYLNKDPFGDYSIAGSIFLDYRNLSDFSDEYSLVYGHHMEFGHMFGALDEFRNEDYFNNHLIGTLTIENKVYNLEFFACFESDGASSEVFVPGKKETVLNFAKERALIWREPKNGYNIIALSTCKFPETTERTIILGVIK